MRGIGARDLSDWIFRRGGRNRLINWIGIDSWIDSTLAETWERSKDRWNAASSFFARFRLSGWQRTVNELLSEAMTTGVGGMALLLALALPALEEIDQGAWLATGKYSVTFVDRSGQELGKRGILHSDAVPLEELPDHLIKATLATEDRRFFDHFGIDFLGTLRALFENVRANDVVQGGSTLTQQLAKNLFLSSERSLTRKIKEAFLALWLESRLTKRELLKLYLDRAYMGGGAFGVEAAAQFYFGKSARDVSLAEAAMMAGLFKAPTKYAPHNDLAASRARANEVLSNLVEAGYMTEAQVHPARLKPAKVVERRRTNSPDWYLDWAFEEIQKLFRGKNEYVLTAVTTIDLAQQKAAEEALVTIVRQMGRARRARQGALVAMEPDGAVRAIVGGIDYGRSQFNRATHARRQPGSSFKPYVYVTALQHGYSPATTVRDRPGIYCGRWSPKNYSGGYRGRMSMARALAKSVNTIAVDLSLKVGRKRVLRTISDLGIVGVRRSCSMALGDTGITPLSHTAGYAAFANGGFVVKPYAIIEVRNSKGQLLYERRRSGIVPKRVLPARVVGQLNGMLKMVVDEGTGRRAALEFTHAVGKTGTSSSYRDAWFMGFTGKLVTGVWIGNDDFSPTGRVTGGNLPAMVWNKFMSVAHHSLDIPRIPGLRAHPQQIAERQRLEALRRANPTYADAMGRDGEAAAHGGMPERTKAVLSQIARKLRKAAGLPEPKPVPPEKSRPPGTRAEAPTTPRAHSRLAPTATGRRVERR